MEKSIKNDALILQLKNQIEEKKNALEKIQKFSPVSNCSLTLFNIRYNLHVSSLEELEFLQAFLESFNNPSLTISGYTIRIWLGDIENKILYNNRKNEETKLKAMQSKLDTLLSHDTRVELELAELMKNI